MTRRFVLALIAAALLAASVLAQPAAQARTTAQARATVQAKTAFRIWPRHVYAPYFETWTTDSIPAVACEVGARDTSASPSSRPPRRARAP